MAHKLLPLIAIVNVCVVICSAEAALRVPLAVKERANLNRQQSPVSFGVPLAKSAAILSVNELKISESDGGSAIPAQFRVLSRYQGTANDSSRPIRMVLVDFQSSVNAAQERQYYLCDGGAGTYVAPDIASENADNITLDTGRIRVRINKHEFNLFDIVDIDTDDNGTYDRQVIASTGTNGIFVSSQGGTYSSVCAPETISIEENGPLRAVVKVCGYFKNISGEKLLPPSGDNGISFTVRLKAYKGKSYVKADVTLENENQGWAYSATDPVHNILIDSCFVRTTVAGLLPVRTVNLGSFSRTGTAGYTIVQDEISDGTLPEYQWQYKIFENDAQVSTGEKFDSFINVSDGSIGLMAAGRWFWQNFPMGASVENGTLRIDLWPDTGDPHRILGGIWKTHQLIYCFHQNDSSFDEELAGLKNPLIALAQDEYYARADFFSAMSPEKLTSGYTFPSGEKLQAALDAQIKWFRAKFDSAYIESIYEPETIASLRDKRTVKISAEQYGNWYGWLAFGDFVRGNGWGYSGLHYDWAYNSLKYLLQFEDYSSYDLSQELVNHQADILIIHDPLAVEQYPDTHYHGGHRYELDALLSYYDDRSIGTNEPRYSAHFWNRGIMLQYLLSGDERFNDAARESAEHMSYVYVDQKEAQLAENSYFAVRRFGRAVHALVGYYKISGEAKYLDDAWFIFKNGILNCEHIVDGVRMGYLRETANSASALQCGINIEPAIELYYELTAAGRNEYALEVKQLLGRMALWFYDTIYKNWATADCGTYRDGKYFPFGQQKIWYIGSDKWPDGSYGNYYQPYVADLFAFEYVLTGEIEWLNLARSLIKDFYFYPLEGRYLPVAYSPKNSPGVTGSGDAWAKVGQYLKKGFYYRKVEWDDSCGLLYSADKIAPAVPEKLTVK